LAMDTRHFSLFWAESRCVVDGSQVLRLAGVSPKVVSEQHGRTSVAILLLKAWMIMGLGF